MRSSSNICYSICYIFYCIRIDCFFNTQTLRWNFYVRALLFSSTINYTICNNSCTYSDYSFSDFSSNRMLIGEVCHSLHSLCYLCSNTLMNWSIYRQRFFYMFL